ITTSAASTTAEPRLELMSCSNSAAAGVRHSMSACRVQTLSSAPRTTRNITLILTSIGCGKRPKVILVGGQPDGAGFCACETSGVVEPVLLGVDVVSATAE